MRIQLFSPCLITIFPLFVIYVEANYRKYLENLGLEEMFVIMSPKSLLESFVNERNSTIVSDDECVNKLLLYKKGLEEKEIWALRMLDSSSKIPSGLYIGNFIEWGMYDECMEVLINKSNVQIRGNHCAYIFFLLYEDQTFPINPVMSICLPSSCADENLMNIIERRMSSTRVKERFNITGIDTACSDVYSRSSTGAIITGLVLTTIFLFISICTVLDWIQRRKNPELKISRIWNEISFFKSTKEIFSLTNDPEFMPVFHGLRVFNTMIVVLGHGVLIRAASSHANNLDLAYLPLWQSFIVSLIYYAVDTFFMISGFLMTYAFLKKYTVYGEKFHLISYYLHRYIRLTPVIAAMIFMSIYIVPFIGSGPKWRKITRDFLSDACSKKLWTMLSYTSNIFWKDTYCLQHLWSLSVDMQLFWLSPIILLPLSKVPRLGLWILSLLFIVSVITPGYIIAKNHLPFSFYTIKVSFSHLLDMWEKLYTQSYTRASPWLIGIFLGYIEINVTGNLEKRTVQFGWIMSVISFTFCFCGFSTLLRLDYVYNVTWETFFGAISRPIWAAAMAWVIFASNHGYGGIVKHFLSSRLFYPLSRLSYCLYSVHVMVLIVISHTSRTNSYYMVFDQLTIVLRDMLICLIVAYIFCITIEMPIRKLERILHHHAKPVKKNFE